MNLGPTTTHIQRYHDTNIEIPVSENNIPFDSYNQNVEPFVLYRPLNLYKRWLAIIIIDKNNPKYSQLQLFIDDLTNQLDKGSSASFNIYDSDYNTNNSISKHKWYSIDLRTNKDTNLSNLIQTDIKNTDPSWIRNVYFDKCYNKTKGLIIYADSIKDVPSVLIARSSFGLCTLSGNDLANFLFQSVRKVITENNPINKDNSIVGYINCHKWMKLVKI
jgi:hypothetical protein